MTENEIDYMSDDLIPAAAENDIRPGLLMSHQKQREHNMLKKKKENNERFKLNQAGQSATERMEAGLKKPLGPENKGFSMLQKMGFVPGMRLGTTKSGLLEPIPITVKQDKQGLGREAAIEAVRVKKAQLAAARAKRLASDKETPTIESFREAHSKRNMAKVVESDLFKSQVACKNFDEKAGIEEPDELFFWPKSVIEEEDNNEQCPYTVDEQLEMLTVYLKTTYMYCIWCGIKYDSDDDMKDCPGSTRQDH